MLDMAILGLLEEDELHGYEIRKQLLGRFGLLASVSFGSLYPALARLEDLGAVEAIAARPSGRRSRAAAPPTGSLSGELAVLRARHHPTVRGTRAKKVYRITDVGRRLFVELLEAGGADDARSFGLRLAFARHLAPQARVALLERRRAVLAERLREARSADGDGALDPYARSVLDHSAESVERDIAWLERLIAAERAGVERDHPAVAAPDAVLAGTGARPAAPAPVSRTKDRRSGITRDRAPRGRDKERQQ
jgi:DNA-binding PadR family transcriptional regulator